MVAVRHKTPDNMNKPEKSPEIAAVSAKGDVTSFIMFPEDANAVCILFATPLLVLVELSAVQILSRLLVAPKLNPISKKTKTRSM